MWLMMVFTYTAVSNVHSGIPSSDKRVLRLRFKMWKGSKKIDSEKAVLFAAYLVDAIGSTMKLSRDVRCCYM